MNHAVPICKPSPSFSHRWRLICVITLARVQEKSLKDDVMYHLQYCDIMYQSFSKSFQQGCEFWAAKNERHHLSLEWSLCLSSLEDRITICWWRIKVNWHINHINVAFFLMGHYVFIGFSWLFLMTYSFLAICKWENSRSSRHVGGNLSLAAGWQLNEHVDTVMTWQWNPQPFVY